MAARDEVLGRIRAALIDAPAATQAVDAAQPGGDPQADGNTRAGGEEAARPGYRTHGDLDTAQLLDLLAERLLDYGAKVRRAAPDQVLAEVSAALAERGARRLVVPPGLDLPGPPGSDRPGSDPPGSDLAGSDLAGLGADVEIVVDDGLSAEALDGFDGVITRAAVAIAETGTIVLDASAGQGRRAISLIPDYHLCLLNAGQVVALVPEAIERLRPDRPLTWISGGSATSDIELDRVEGVHGPRTLEVILISP